MPATASKPFSAVAIGAIGAAAVLLLVGSVIAVLPVLIAQGTCSGSQAEAVPSADAEHSIPARYLALYRDAGHMYRVPWQVLAGIGSIETDHGRSRAPGVRSGVNSYGCCAGPMQFNVRDGPLSTWDRYGVDGNHDDTRNIYDPQDAIPRPPTTSASCCATPTVTSAKPYSATTTRRRTSTTCSHAPTPTRD